MITVYANLNCPFCYALSEWIDEAGLQSLVDWQLIDHNPQATFYGYSDEELIDLTEEIFTLRQRAPDIDILLPQGPTNVRHASNLLSHVKTHHPDQFYPLKQKVYRAYWRGDANIESVAVLVALARDVGVALGEQALEQLPEHDVKAATEAWDRGPFERRIPVIQRSDTVFNLGLPPKRETLAYLCEGTGVALRDSRSCDYEVRPHVGVLGDWSEAWGLLKDLRCQCDLFYYPDLEVLAEHCEHPTPPELVLVNWPEWEAGKLAELAEIQRVVSASGVSVVVLSSGLAEAAELSCYELGCAEVLVDQAVAISHLKITRLLEAQVRLARLLKNSLVDSLTQLQNRRGFISILEKEWSRASRSKSSFSLVMIDLDYFKRYNDHYGHLAGDGCLRQVASIIHACTVRKSDAACRYGGEEFILVLPETDSDGAVAVAEHIMARLQEVAIVHAASPLGRLTLSIGVTSHSYQPRLSINDLIRDVDEQLYAAKAAGRNCVRVKTHR